MLLNFTRFDRHLEALHSVYVQTLDKALDDSYSFVVSGSGAGFEDEMAGT